MEIHSNLEYLCRVCAANTKGKNSVAEYYNILKTPGLKDKLDKFLYLKIADNDSLPKVLCKSCYRQVEATASLSKIAKHTQQAFRDFLQSNLPKNSSDPVNTSELISSDFLGNKESEKSQNDHVVVPPPAPANSLAQLPPLPLVQAVSTTGPRKDELVVNVSVSDPLTRDNQLKMISNSQRRQSVMIEPRYTPTTIAQKPRQIAPKPQSLETANNTTNNQKTNSQVFNFLPVKPQQQQPKQQQPAQVTTFTSGGYVIGNLNTDSNNKEEPKKTSLPLAPAADNVLQQKRKNLVKALNNIKANNLGQVSLLKSSQQKQTLPIQNVTKIPLAEVVNQAAEDELPDKIIIAAPKKKSPEKSKKEPLNLSGKFNTAKPANQNPPTTATIQEQPPTYNHPPKPSHSKSTFPEDILLGRVIRDMDLLKLILKALKWPVSKQNMELQLERLKKSKFTDVMSDSNLLQDTDLTQLLGPYLAPVLFAAQALQQQQHQLLQNTTLNHNMSTSYVTQKSPPTMDSQAQAEINKSMPYKLPPETSVQLVPATPEEQEASKTPPLPMTLSSSSTSSLKRNRKKEPKPAVVPPKRQRRKAAQKARDSIVISDEEDDEPLKNLVSRQTTSKSTPDIQLQLNDNFMTQLGVLNGSGGDEANEALIALLNRQKAAISKQQKLSRRRRNSVSNMITLPASEFDALIDLDDDIVLMEPVTTTSSDSLTTSLGQPQQQLNDHNTFIMPTMPLITRPIIKRRKTVIQTSRGSYGLTTNSAVSLANVGKEQPTQVPLNIVNIGLQIPSNMENQQQKQDPSKYLAKSTSLELLTNSLAATSASSLLSNRPTAPMKLTTQQKKLQNKAALGQQLLEAIGLQQIAPKLHNNTPQSETATLTNIPITSVIPTNKQSIQQIRSALKKSLKQAQEQQQQRKFSTLTLSNTTTIIQDADSTTKPSVKEIVVVEGKGTKSDNYSSSMVDVEEQIDKVTLMVRKNAASDKEDKREGKKLQQSKIPERRRTTMPVTAAARGALSAIDSKLEKSLNTIEVISDTKIIEILDNDKSEKEDSESPNISSSSGVTMPISLADSMTSSEMNQSKEEMTLTPKRRGRKRIVDRAKDTETTTQSEKDVEATPITEGSQSKDEDAGIEANNNRTDEETSSNINSGRPTRQSKTLSKYYKGPGQPTQGRRSLPSRSTRNRKYC